MKKEETYRFARIKRRDIDYPAYWVVVLDSLPRVMRYLEEVKSHQLWRGLQGTKKENERNPHNPHYRGIEFEVNWTIVLADDEGAERETVFDDMMILGEKFNTPYLRVFRDLGTLYVNDVGGFFAAATVPHEILEEFETDQYEYPVEKSNDVQRLKDVRIFQWKGGGTHYYAKVGVTDVVVNGKQKWNTWEQAENAAKKFLKNGEVLSPERESTP